MRIQQEDIEYLTKEAEKQAQYRLKNEEVRSFLAKQAEVKRQERMAEKEQDRLVRQVC